MKKKNGFIATSILYSFFLVFVTLFVGLINNYLQNKVLLTNLNDASKDELKRINGLRMIDLKIGDHINFKLKEDQTLINKDSEWILSYIESDDQYRYYYFLSDLDAQNLDILYKLSTDKIVKMHSMTIDVYEDLIKIGAYPLSFYYPNLSISIPSISLLENIRNQSLDPVISKNIYNVGGNYIIYADKDENNYVSGKYYEYRMYRFNEKNQTIINHYCSATFDTTRATYDLSNTFGYVNIENNVTNNSNYINYCYNANPNSYTHTSDDKVVYYDEKKENGDLIEDTNSSIYTFRLVAMIKVHNDQTNSYIASGKGTKAEPYLLTDGVKVS